MSWLKSSTAKILLLGNVWGAAFLLLNVAVSHAGAPFTTLGRLLVAVLVFMLLLFFLRKHWQSFSWGQVAVAIASTAAPFALFAYAATHLPPGYLSILNATAPFQSVLLGALFFNYKSSARMYVGVVFGFLGVFALSALGPVSMSPQTLLAFAAALLGACGYALGSYWILRWCSQNEPVGLALNLQILSALFIAPWAIYAWPNIHSLPPSAWLCIGALGAFCTAWAYLLYFNLLEQIGPVKTSAVGFVIPASAMFWSALLLSEPLGWGHAFGFFCIATALWLLSHKP